MADEQKTKREQAPYRKIVRKTWRKLKFRQESPEMKLLLMYLWTAPDSHMPGLYYISPGAIADDLATVTPMVTETVTETVTEQLRNGCTNGWFQYDFEARLIFFPKWVEYDPPPNRNAVASYMRQMLDLPDSKLTHLYAETLQPYIKRYAVQLPEPFQQRYSDRFGTPIPLPLPLPLPINKVVFGKTTEIIEDLNARTGKKFRPQTTATRKAVAARLEEGRTVDDFKRVHKVKAAEWLEDPDMNKYLCPATLYRPANFEKYLNQKDEQQENMNLINEVLGDE